MRFGLSRRLGYLIVAGLLLLAIAGATDSFGDAMRDNYNRDCRVLGGALEPAPRDPGNETNGTDTENTPPTPEERQQCRDARRPLTIVDAFMQATMAPGIAIIAICAVYLIAQAIAARKR